MRDMPVEDIHRRIRTRRQEVDHKVGLVKTNAEALVRRHGGAAAGVALTALAALGLYVIVYGRRQRQSLAERIHAAQPWSVPDLPEESAKRLKRPLPRNAGSVGPYRSTTWPARLTWRWREPETVN
jgi:hypothetical protein